MIKQFIRIISWISLAILIAPALLFLFGKIELDQVKIIMLIATVAWFITATAWFTAKKA
ncbi:MAG: hypothetical protein H8D47_03825 [Planctomycetes bacterium]|nr:hypothetical protein [Planctomycetota bacterium]MBL7106802.1 hypothetical protein [Phycisphaerae bacterium]